VAAGDQQLSLARRMGTVHLEDRANLSADILDRVN
jgi:hypothetical protein